MTFIIPEKIKSAIKTHALSDPTNEACGYWVPKESLVLPCENVADDKSKSFRIDPDLHVDMMSIYQNPIIYHTHVGDDVAAILSESDIVASKALKMPYLLYHTGFDQYDYFDPSNLDSYPLIANPHSSKTVEFYLDHRWQWNRWDCFTLFRNYYRGVLGINIKDFSRKGGESAVLENSWNQYEDNYESQNFRKLEKDEPLKNHDVMLMNLIGDNIHHAVIVINAVNNIGIQMLGENRLSEKFLITKSHLDRTKLIIRHNTLDK